LGDKKKEAFTERMIEWFALIAEALRTDRHTFRSKLKECEVEEIVD